MDNRHQRRLKIIQELYSYTFHTKDSDFFNSLDEKTKLIIKNQKEINVHVQRYASKFPIEKIAKVDLAILQLSIYDLVFEKKEPNKVIIDEAIELAKELGSERSYAFINAVLGKVYKENYEKQPKRTGEQD